MLLYKKRNFSAELLHIYSNASLKLAWSPCFTYKSSFLVAGHKRSQYAVVNLTKVIEYHLLVDKWGSKKQNSKKQNSLTLFEFFDWGQEWGYLHRFSLCFLCNSCPYCILEREISLYISLFFVTTRSHLTSNINRHYILQYIPKGTF